ncbi:methyl-accepting chemotaxis protein [Chitinibacteraceae bacterium HSL-7]
MLTIRTRLISTIGLLATLLIVIGLIGVLALGQSHRAIQSIYQDRVVPLQQLKHLADAYAVQVIDAVNKTNAGLMDVAQTRRVVTAARSDIRADWQAYMATQLTPREAALAKEAAGLFVPADAAVERLLARLATLQGRVPGALDEFDGPLYQAIDPIGGKVAELIQLQLDVAKHEFDESSATYLSVRVVAISAIVIGVVLAVVWGWMLLRAISVPLNRAVFVARRIAEGQVDNEIIITRRDETGQLLEAMQRMQQSIAGLISAQGQMALAHGAGQVSVRMDAGHYPGAFGDMAAQVNALVDQQQQVNDQAIAVIARYAQGDFEPDMPALPGELQRVTQALASVKQNLLAISSDIERLAAAGAVGNFEERCRPEHYEHMFRTMAEHLNRLIETCDVGFNDVLRVAEALAAGRLDERISTPYPGLFGRTADGVNATVDALADIIGDVERVVRAAAVEGDFGRRLSADGRQGFTLALAQLLNELSSVTETGLRDVMRVAQALADGDLTQRIEQNYPGLFGETGEAVNTTVEHLRGLVGGIQASAATIHSAALEIAQGNADLSRRTEAQAASLEETASSSEELTSTVQQNAANAREAEGVAAESAAVASAGASAVGEVVTTMQEIEQASRRIVDIIAVIDGIAFQTNILALNAAVEAARAGEQGRGFAVVASEVRTLAQRSSVAAREIKTLIGTSSVQVEQGVARVKHAGDTIASVEAHIGHVNLLMREIAGASLEQADGISQVNQAVTQMDSVTQQNAALVEEAAAAAESLKQQAEALSEAVGVFKLERVGSPAASSLLGRAALPSPEWSPA